jgi:CRISPR/Cas system-associated exonuclease Cas4 (RecB family)
MTDILEKIKSPTWKVNDPTKITEFIRCPRRYFYEYVLGWRPETPSNHLVFGSAVHEALEHLLLNGYTDNEIIRAHEKFLTYYRGYFPPETDEIFVPKTPDNFFIVLAAYAKKYFQDLENFEVLYTEIAGEVALSNDHVAYFRMDSILRNLLNSKIFSLEHKTGSSGYNWESQWDLSTQVGMYTHVLYCLYEPEVVEGIRINGLLFFKVKKGWEQLARALPLSVKPPFELRRYAAFKSNDQMQVWLWNTLYYLDQIRWNFDLLKDCRERDDVMMAFPMRPVACGDYGGCPWHDFCLAWANPLQRAWEPPPGYKVEHWDPRSLPTKHTFKLGEETRDEE